MLIKLFCSCHRKSALILAYQDILSIPLFSFDWLNFGIVIIVINYYMLSLYFYKSQTLLYMLMIFSPFRYLMKFYHDRSSNKNLYLPWFRKEIYQISPISSQANLQSFQDIVLNRVHRITLPSDSRMKPKFHILYDFYLDSRTKNAQYFFYT